MKYLVYHLNLFHFDKLKIVGEYNTFQDAVNNLEQLANKSYNFVNNKNSDINKNDNIDGYYFDIRDNTLYVTEKCTESVQCMLWRTCEKKENNVAVFGITELEESGYFNLIEYNSDNEHD